MKRLFIVLLFLIYSSFAPSIKADGFKVEADGFKVEADGFKIESIGALSDAKVADSMRNAVESKGFRVLDDQGKGLCEIWLSKTIPTKKADVPGANFAQIPEGTFIGVINFLSDASDYRGQGIKSGFYTLRYGLILQDGNHLGASPARDFFIASLTTEDKNPAVPLKTDELYKISRNVTGTGHPSVWCLVLVSSREGLPKVVKNESEHVVVELNIPAGSGPAIGMVIVGKGEV